ncbi:MAG TPA: hypothetical protein VIY48_07470, partial [Candidatus Paceibacterota bacterium]
CVAGTTEKPNSQFKKKEAVQIAQAMGQFASAAPITSMSIMLKVLEQAFTEVDIQPEDWDNLKKEAQANAQKGISTGQAPDGGAAPGGAPAPGGDPNAAIKQKLMSLPPQVKQKVVQMKQQGASDQQIKQFLMQQIGGGGGAPPQPAQGQPPAPQPQAQPQQPPQIAAQGA